MLCLRALILATLLMAAPVRAVYAPLPEAESPNAFSATLRGGVTYDTNIFGAPAAPIDSLVYEFAPHFSYHIAISPQSFLLASYQLILDHFVDRPGEKTLAGHDVEARFVHAFDAVSSLDFNERFQVSRNPAALLNGLPYNTDQSYESNQLDGRYIIPVGPKTKLVAKIRSLYYHYDESTLSDELDRFENLAGLSGDYAVFPEIEAVTEYRHQDILYQTAGALKDKHSDFFMAGADYAVASRMTAGARLGFEYRRRSGEPDTTAPYFEFTLHRDYAERAFVSFGYIYTLDETSDILRFDDTRVNRLFLGWQQPLSPLVVASATLAYEPGRLRGRGAQVDISETAERAGVALSYYYTKNWTFSATYDYDRVNSDDPSRSLRRSRTGVNVAFLY